MSITRARAREIIEEVFNKKKLQEAEVPDDEGQQGNQIKNPLADINAIRRMINSRLEGKMEWRQGAVMFLEFVFEFLEEGAQASDLLIICKELMGDAHGNRLYNTLKIMAQVYNERKKAGTLEDVDADFAGDIESKIAALGEKGLDSPQKKKKDEAGDL
tara:strand:- start:33803 stop:34279 length:477 start_codon:yes stop_codon:yes gene_type:complete